MSKWPMRGILDIYVSRPFQWHQEHPNARCFAPCCRTLNIRESRRTPNPNSFQVLGFTPTLGQVRVATTNIGRKLMDVDCNGRWHDDRRLQQLTITIGNTAVDDVMVITLNASLAMMVCRRKEWVYNHWKANLWFFPVLPTMEWLSSLLATKYKRKWWLGLD
jgi:hypothetical protein